MRGPTIVMSCSLIALLLLRCGKKGEEDAGYDVRIISEDVQSRVEMPEPAWETSVAILHAEEAAGQSEGAGLASIIADRMASNLSKSTGAKVFSLKSEQWLEDGIIEADYIVQSTIDKNGDMFTASIELIETENRSVIWADVYEDNTESLFKVTESAAASISGVLTETQSLPEAVYAPASPDLISRHIKARSLLERGVRSDTDLAIQEFKAILRADSAFAPAAAGLAECYLQILENQWERNLVFLRLAQDACIRAIQTDPNYAEAFMLLGRVYLKRGDFKHAEEQFKKSLGINPNLDEAWTGLGSVFIHFGLYEPCLQAYEKALALNPSSTSTALSRAMILIGLRRYSQAEREIDRMMAFYPDDAYLSTFMALIHFYQEDLERAGKEIRRGLTAESYAPLSHAVFAMMLAKQKKLDEALAEVELDIKPVIGNDASLATAVAAIYTLIGQKGQAVLWLGKAVEWGYKEYPWLANDPNFEDLKDDERFRSIMDRLKSEWEGNMRRYGD